MFVKSIAVYNNKIFPVWENQNQTLNDINHFLR